MFSYINFATARTLRKARWLQENTLECNKLVVDFIILEGDATLLAIEDDIRADLAKVGVDVNLRALPKDEFNVAMVSGDFNLAFSETWGPPYDPHSYATSWKAPDEAYYAALKGLPAPNTKAVLDQKIADTLLVEDETAREESWSEILNILHDQATEIPISGKSIPAVMNSRLSGYEPGKQQYDYPIHKLRVISGSKNVTLAPGAQTGLFQGVGRLDPHSYRPNEFFSNNWVYEGLVEYGPNGAILPSLAISWIVEDVTGGKQKYTFNLRQGVKFHDDADWDCSVAKLNLDHVFAAPLTTPDWHGWYGLPDKLESWSCASPYVLEMIATDSYYPLLQELSYIRPLRMLSPNMFVGGASSDSLTQNSCPTGWESATLGNVTVTCAGVTGIAGTGRWEYLNTVMDPSGEQTDTVTFQRFNDHWDSYGGTDGVEFVELVYYPSQEAVKAALDNNDLDAVIGAGVLDPEAVREFKGRTDFTVSMSEPLQNRIVVFNTAKAPTDELQNRKVMIHAVDKAAIIQKELAGLDEPVDSLFPKTAPYSDVDLTPKWDYDFEKATLLNCPKPEESYSLPTGAIVAIAVSASAVIALAMFVGYMRYKERLGKPVFKSLIDDKAEVL
ncbi:hypothetical protein TrST_g11459 [Triparma strigata]|uniref:Solute-binding protein family 5 domain-containing protein n=1 Tax=Triparma strigata TaxID=1606541 RepID=A0A9W7A5Q3_9STRA|nr:hypothetical protein TrST_g11459 [Triparma strigata]